jgi:hypothetical protein
MASGASIPVNVPRLTLSTAELSRRPSRAPDHAAENEALIELARVMATSPDAILQKLAETALRLCRAHSAGLSLHPRPRWPPRAPREASRSTGHGAAKFKLRHDPQVKHGR